MSETPVTDTVDQPVATSSVIIRPWPKVVFFYPTFICATLLWTLSMVGIGGESRWQGNLFVLVFFLNLLVFAFDFSRIKSLTLLILVVAIVLGVLWANTMWSVVGFLKDLVDTINIQMNSWFYGTISASFAFVLLLVLINTRFNYYEINHREILHHHGYLGDITRLPTAGLHLNKEIYDLVEYLLLRSGRLIFYPQGTRDVIVIDNVINVNQTEKHIKDLLSVMAVRVQPLPS
jgi:hypothetical protein